MVDLRKQVKRVFPRLNPNQKVLVREILAHYEEFIFLSVEEAANALGVHKSTLVRLAQKLGYPGYPAFRSALQELYRQEVSPGKKLGRALAEVADENIYARLVETEIAYLRESLNSIRPEDVLKAAQLISNAKRVFICGRGPQAPLTELFAFRLRRFHLDVIPIPEEGRGILEKLQLLTPDDVLIIYTFLFIPKDYLNALMLAKEVGAPVILITDTVVREMVSDVAVVLAARRGPAGIYHTNIVPLAIQTALVLQVAKLRSSEVLKHLEYLQELRRRFGYEYYLPPSQRRGRIVGTDGKDPHNEMGKAGK